MANHPDWVQEKMARERQFNRMPPNEKWWQAAHAYCERCRWSKAPERKPRVRVLPYGKGVMLVLPAGRYYVAARSWETLVRTAALGKWRKLEGAHVAVRLA